VETGGAIWNQEKLRGARKSRNRSQEKPRARRRQEEPEITKMPSVSLMPRQHHCLRLFAATADRCS
jgi:hypothetical protein